MNILKISIISLFLVTAGLFVFTLYAPLNVNAAGASEAVCDTLGEVDSNGDCTDSGGTINGTLTIVLNILSFVAGVIAVIMIIIAGIKFITSQGDSGKVSGARNTVLYAVIGIVIVVISQTIVRFVLTETTSLGTVEEESSLVIYRA